MPSQVIYEVCCPACGTEADLRVVAPFQEHHYPQVVEFTCPREIQFGHVTVSDQELLQLLPAEIVFRIDDEEIDQLR